MIAADYPFLDVMWSVAILFLWLVWLWLLFSVFADLFRRRDLSGLGKTAWILFASLLPFLGVFVYVITQNVAILAITTLVVALDVAWKRARGGPELPHEPPSSPAVT